MLIIITGFLICQFFFFRFWSTFFINNAVFNNWFVFSLDKPKNMGYIAIMKTTINIIPKPYSIISTDGSLNISEKSYCCNESLPSFIVKLLDKAGFSKISQDSSSLAACLKIRINHVDKTFKDEDFLLENPEAYILQVTANETVISASSDKGVLYGLVTLSQILMEKSDSIPLMKICDKPEYSWRGFLLDTSRHFYTVDFIKKIIDLSCFHKMNVFHWHLTDDQGWRLPVEKYPRLTETGSIRQAHTVPESTEGTYEGYGSMNRFYTHEEIRDIVTYASERNIEIVPEIEFPGHVSALLAAYPEYGCTGGPYAVENRWGIFPDVLCLGKDSIFEIYDEILSTVEKLFPGKYIHIGGDECLAERWEQCPDCQKRMKENNLQNAAQLQSWATSRMLKMVQKHNRIPIGWDECLENTEIIPVSENLVIQSWRGFEGGETAVKSNHQVIMSPQTHCYLNLKNIESYEEPGRLGTITIDKAYSFVPYTEKMSPESRKFILGGECTFWSEYITASRITEYLMFPRFCALSECLWLPENLKSFDDFKNRLETHKKRLNTLDTIFFE